MKYATFALALMALPATAQTLAPGNSMSVSGVASIRGVGMSDQWGNPWIEVTAVPGKGKATVSIFDCTGKSSVIGEVPLSSLGSENNFKGFKPYMNATLKDLAAVSNESTFERNCMAESRSGQACEANPKRSDCRVVLQPTDGGNMIPADAWKALQRNASQKHTIRAADHDRI